MTLYVSTTGSDSNNGLTSATPFATIQHAVDVAPVGTPTAIQLANGVYHQRTNIVYYKVISLLGNPANNLGVIIDDNGIGPGIMVSAQDHCIATTDHISFASYSTGSTGFATRQYAIGDVNNARFFSFVGGNAVAANEGSKVNLFNTQVGTDASRFATVADNSQLNVGGSFDYLGGTFNVAMFSVLFGGILNFVPSSVSGSSSSYSYQGAGGIIKNAGAIPGIGAYPGMVNTQLY